MLDRRSFLRLGVAGVLASARTGGAATARPRLVFIHGRDQQGKNPTDLKKQWVDALQEGAQKVGRKLPSGVQIAFPYYGDTLDGFARQAALPLTSDIRTRGAVADNEFLKFQADVAEALQKSAGVTDAQVNTEYGQNPKPKGPLNWEWVQAILSAVDKHGGGVNQLTLETFTRDVFLYTTRAGVRDAIDEIVRRDLTAEPTVVVAHSLGTVVAYSILSSAPQTLTVPLLVTVGSPLGVRAIRDQFRPLRHPSAVASWYNAYDTRDVVALYPLDSTNFPVNPGVTNSSSVRNRTKNRHGIIGYLDDPDVAKHVLDALG